MCDYPIVILILIFFHSKNYLSWFELFVLKIIWTSSCFTNGSKLLFLFSLRFFFFDNFSDVILNFRELFYSAFEQRVCFFERYFKLLFNISQIFRSVMKSTAKLKSRNSRVLIFGHATFRSKFNSRVLIFGHATFRSNSDSRFPSLPAFKIVATFNFYNNSSSADEKVMISRLLALCAVVMILSFVWLTIKKLNFRSK